MPTRCYPTSLLALAALTATAVGGETDVSSLDPNAAFSRLRPGVSSSGPQGLRRRDPDVEPAAFRSLGLAIPLAPPATQDAGAETLVNEPRDPLTAAEPTATPASLERETQPSAAVEEPAAAEPQPLAVPPARGIPKTSPGPPDTSGRLLGASSPASGPSRTKSSLAKNPLQAVMDWRPSPQTMTTTGAGLSIAIGLLLSFVWLIRSMAPKSSRALPREVVEVLGRAPLAGKQTTQLVRVGHKLVLVAVTPDGAETLTEITDPDEVARLVAACDAGGGRGSTAEFDAMLRQMESQRTSPGFLDPRDDRHRYDDAHGFADGGFDPRSLAAAYANTPGGRGDG